MRRRHVVVVGAGAGGLSAAIDCASRGFDVTVVERAANAGGKIRELHPGGGAGIDAGPTVFTMRWVFDALFADAGASLDDALRLAPLDRLARHFWRDAPPLDLFGDIEQSVDAIGTFAGAADATAYRTFCEDSAALFALLRETFVTNHRPSHLDVVRRVGVLGMPAFLRRIKPFATLWQELSQRFASPHLRQLFARYATYVGSSPFTTPATIMIVAHVEQDGVWRVEGGMIALANALHRLAADSGASFRFNTAVERIAVEGGRASGVTLAGGEHIAADAVIFNGDIAALGAGLLGDRVRHGGRATKPAKRSLSAITWCTAARASGEPLEMHNVFFGGDYRDEFDAIFRRRTIAADPTVYVCAQDRGAGPVAGGPERLLLLVNAPADGAAAPTAPDLVDRAQSAIQSLMADCGLTLDMAPEHTEITTPSGFEARFPATGGALYGQSVHGAMATMARLGARTAVPGLFIAGGSVHPGPGVPMATISGRLAADAAATHLAANEGNVRRAGRR